jgi:hypothetical protein
MKNILDLTMFLSVLINLIYFNYYLSSSITKKGFKSIINENPDDEIEAIKQMAYLVLAFLGIIYFDITSAYSLWQNFNLSNILSFGKDAANLSISILLDIISEILPDGVYDITEQAFGFFNIKLNENLTNIIGLLFSLLFNFIVIKSCLSKKSNNPLSINSPEKRLLNKNYTLEDSFKCFISLLFFDATGYFINNEKLEKLISNKLENSVDNGFSLLLFNNSLKEYLEDNDVCIQPALGQQSWDVKYRNKRSKYLNNVYLKLYSELNKNSINEKENIANTVHYFLITLNKCINFSEKKTQIILKNEGSGDWIKDSLNKSLQAKLAEFSFRGLLGKDEDPVNQIAKILKNTSDTFESKLKISRLNIEQTKDKQVLTNQQDILSTILEFILDNEANLEYSHKEKLELTTKCVRFFQDETQTTKRYD